MKKVHQVTFTHIYRVEIIRLSDKSFKETIKDVELSTYRSTTKEGYVSMDPSKPLPHEFAEGKLSRYSDNGRQKFTTHADEVDGSEQQNDEDANELEAEFVSQYANANDSVILNKTEFREILMSALNNTSNNNASSKSEQLNSVSTTDVPIASDNDVKPLSNDQMLEITASPEQIQISNDDVVYLNETIEKSTTNDDAQKNTNPISLDTPEVDKLLNEGEFSEYLSFHNKQNSVYFFHWKKKKHTSKLIDFRFERVA